MNDDTQPTQPTPTTATAPTIDGALANAARLLSNAEMETNLPLMERLEHLADSWLSIAALLMGRERDCE